MEIESLQGQISLISCRNRQNTGSIGAIIPLRSSSFLRPAKTIFVPGMYLAGFSKYSNIVSSDHVMPEHKPHTNSRVSKLIKNAQGSVSSLNTFSRNSTMDTSDWLLLTLLLVLGSVGETGGLTSLAAEHSVEVGASLVWTTLMSKQDERGMSGKNRTHTTGSCQQPKKIINIQPRRCGIEHSVA